MRIILSALALVILLCSLLSTAAVAQYSDEPSRLNLKFGFYRPTNSFAQDNAGKTWSMQGVTYDQKRDEVGHPTVQFGLGMMSGRALGTDNRIIMLEGNKYWWKDPDKETSLYASAGLGIYRIKIFTQRETNPGLQLSVGYNIQNSYYVEVRGLIVQPISGPGGGADLNMSGIGLSVGTRRLF